MVDIPAPEHGNRDRAVLVELHRIKYNALHFKTRTRFGLKQHAVDLTAVDTGSQAAAATACECAVVFENLKQPVSVETPI